jgi:hypothetical protein
VDTLVHGAHIAAKQAAFGQERFALVCSSVHRSAVLGRGAWDDRRDVEDVLEPGCHLIGLQTIAELSPTLGFFDGVGSGGITVTTIGETVG